MDSNPSSVATRSSLYCAHRCGGEHSKCSRHEEKKQEAHARGHAMDAWERKKTKRGGDRNCAQHAWFWHSLYAWHLCNSYDESCPGLAHRKDSQGRHRGQASGACVYVHF